MTRRDSTRHLLTSLIDARPAPKTSTGQMVARSTLRGPSPSRKEACPDCGGDGTIGKKRYPCRTCGGDPVKGTPGRGWRIVDDYTGQPVGTLETGTVAQTRRSVTCDGCGGSGIRGRDPHEFAEGAPARGYDRCRHCEGTGRVDVILTPPEERRGIVDVGAAEVAAAAAGASLTAQLRREGDYDRLEDAMSELAVVRPGWHASVWRRWVEPEDVVLSEPVLRAADRGLEWLTHRMPATVRVPGAVLAARGNASVGGKGRHANGAAQARRDEEMRGLALEGWSQSALASRFGVSQGRVSRIVAAGGTAVAA